jgi:hypothetical protein
MKSFLFKLVFLAAVFGMSLPLSAASEIIIEKIPGAFKRVSVKMDGPNAPVHISIVAEKGQILIEKHTDAGAIFDLAKLREGNFTIVVSSSLREIQQPMLITSRDIIIQDYLRREIFAPVWRIQDNILDLNWFSTKVSSIHLAIISDGGEEIFAESLKNIIRLERRYDLRALKKGTYTINITTPDKVYSQACRLP